MGVISIVISKVQLVNLVDLRDLCFLNSVIRFWRAQDTIPEDEQRY